MAPQKAPLLYRIVSHILIFGLCVAMPAVVMLIMPVASTTFVRQEGHVSATVVEKVFFVLPFRTAAVSEVTGVDDQHQAGTLNKSTPSGPRSDSIRPQSRSEDMSWLLIQGRNQTAKVPVSPANIDDVRRQVRDYLDDAGQSELKLFTAASWKISVVTAGVLSLLTVIYIACMGWGLLSMLIRKPGPH